MRRLSVVLVATLSIRLMGCGIDVVGSRGDGLTPPQEAGRSESEASAPDASPLDPEEDADANADVADASSDARLDVEVDDDVFVPDSGACGVCPVQTVCVGTQCVSARRVFVSSSTSAADLGGVAGADAKCESLAVARSLGGVWRAWVSNFVTWPAARFTKATVAYRLLDGTKIADDWDDLTNGDLDHAIDRDETGALTDSAQVWTATTAAGAFAGTSCFGFMSSAPDAPQARQGLTSKRNGEWTNRDDQTCDKANGRLYCFEQ